MMQYLILSSKLLKHWELYPLFFLILESECFLHIVHSTEEHSIKPHLVEKSCVCIRMPEGVDLPTDSWLNSKLFKDPLLPVHHILNHIFVYRACFIMHGPSSIKDLNLSIFDQLFDLFLLCFILLVIPLLKKGHLDLGKLSLWIRE